MQTKSHFISIIIPVYNEEKNIPILAGKLNDIIKNESLQYEIIFVNDGSEDNSYNTICSIIKKDPNVRVINLTRNFGHQAALTAGMDHAKGDIVITMDCDMQDPPEVISEMLRKWEEGAMVVFARRKSRNDHILKKYSAHFFYWLLKKYSDLKITGNIGDFRLVDRQVLNKLNSMREKSRYLRGMVAWLGFKYSIIDYDRPERVHGKTGYDLFKMARLAMDGVVGFSSLPLRLGLIIGVFCIITGLFFLTYISFDSVINHVEYPLYKWLTILLFILIGFLFILLWLVAEYIRRIYDETKGRPIYVVDSVNNM